MRIPIDELHIAMINKNTRYHVIPDKVGNGVMIFDSETGAVQYPVCWQDLAAYYYYLVERGRIDESQKLLAESMAGKKPISNMVGTVSKPASISKASLYSSSSSKVR